MDIKEKKKLLKQIVWDYDISVEDLESLIHGTKKQVGHYNREILFRKLLESYSWFTILNIFTLYDIKQLLTNATISKLRTNSLRNKYAYIQKRLQQTLPAAE